LRTEWVEASGPAGDAATASLTKSAINLSKLHAWLTMPSTSSDATSFDYSLGLQPLSDASLVLAGARTYKDQRYGLVLTAPSLPVAPTPRWVYVLGIDCQGSGRLLWPRSGPGGEFPTDNGRMKTIPLPGLVFRITPPYGTDTYVLLTTSSALPEPDILNFDGVVRGGSRGAAESPLESLLRSASEGTRGNGVETPTDWGVDLLQTQSQPMTWTAADTKQQREGRESKCQSTGLGTSASHHMQHRS
jgi:hypothetical protein